MDDEEFDQGFDYELPDNLPGIPILFPRKQYPELSDTVNKLISQSQGIPLIFSIKALYEASENPDYLKKEEKN